MEVDKLFQDKLLAIKPKGDGTQNSLTADGEPDVSVTQNNPSWSEVWPQIVASIISLLTVIQAGIGMAYSGVLIPQLASDPNFKDFTKEDASWIASIGVISVPIGALLVGPLMDFIGRRKTCVVTNIPSIVGWLIIYFTKDSLWMIYLSRLLVGFSAGMSTIGVVYTAEISHAQYRPMLLSLNSVNVALGILITTIFGVYIEWHVAGLLFGLSPILALISSFFIPESPYWLASFTNVAPARLRKEVSLLNRNSQLFNDEWKRIVKILEDKKKNIGNESSSSLIITLKAFLERSSYKPLFLLLLLFAFQQISGTYVVIFYTVNIFKSIGGNFGFGMNEYNSTAVLGILRFIMSLITTVLSKKVGRQPLLIASSAIMALSCVSAAITLSINNISTIKFESYNLTETVVVSKNHSIDGVIENNSNLIIDNVWILITILVFVCASSFGQMVIPWTMMGELLPTKIRAFGSGIIVSYANVILFCIIKTFPFFVDYITLPYVFVCYSIISALSIIYTYLYIPETFGKSFIEIAKYFEKA